jgi:hypothetical protein
MVTTEVFSYKGERWERWTEQHYEQWVMGVDLGQRADFTAISAIQHTRVAHPWMMCKPSPKPGMRR